jgi:hypothetical protein
MFTAIVLGEEIIRTSNLRRRCLQFSERQRKVGPVLRPTFIAPAKDPDPRARQLRARRILSKKNSWIDEPAVLAGACRVLGVFVFTHTEICTSGIHLRQPPVRPVSPGAFADRSFWSLNTLPAFASLTAERPAVSPTPRRFTNELKGA